MIFYLPKVSFVIQNMFTISYVQHKNHSIIFLRLASVGILGKEREPGVGKLGWHGNFERNTVTSFKIPFAGFLNFLEIETVYTSLHFSLHFIVFCYRDDVVNAINRAVDEREEGIVIKDPSSTYKPSKRKGSFLKSLLN